MTLSTLVNRTIIVLLFLPSALFGQTLLKGLVVMDQIMSP